MATDSVFRKWATNPANWLAIGIALAMLFALEKATQSTRMPRVMVGSKDEVLYFHRATQQDAVVLGRALKNVGYFTDHGAGVVLDKSGGGTVLSFVLQDGTWLRPNAVTDFGDIARRIAPAVGGFPFKVRLVDEKLAVRKDVAVGKEMVGMHDTIFYYGLATSQDALALGNSLRAAGALHDTGITVVLAKGDVTSISFVVHQTPWESPQAMTAFESVTRQVAPAVGGLPVKLRFLDTAGEIRKEVSIE